MLLQLTSFIGIVDCWMDFCDQPGRCAGLTWQQHGNPRGVASYLHTPRQLACDCTLDSCEPSEGTEGRSFGGRVGRVLDVLGVHVVFPTTTQIPSLTAVLLTCRLTTSETILITFSSSSISRNLLVR